MRRAHPIVLMLLLIMVCIILSFVLFEQLSSNVINGAAEQLSQLKQANIWVALLMVSVLMLDVLLPIPSSLVAVYTGTSFGLIGGGVLIWLGLTLGCLFGYWLGWGVGRVLPKSWLSQQDVNKAHGLSKSLDSLALVLMRGIPVMAETSVIAAGMLTYSFTKFLLLTGLANAGIALVYAYVGSQLSEAPILSIIAASIALPTCALLAKLVFDALFTNKNSGLDLLFKREKPLAAAGGSSVKSNQIAARFQVDYAYDVHFTNHAFQADNRTLIELMQADQEAAANPKVFCIIDDGITRHNADFTSQVEAYFSPAFACQTLVLEGGESCKKQANIDQLVQHMLTHKLDRHSWVIAIGGGALVDCAGFACSIFHRGIRLIRMPSTVLGQNDAGIGVKNGINAYQQKNLLGVFSAPYAVVNDFQLLTSLSDRDKRAGLAEAIKVALIKDAGFFYWLEENAESLSQFEPAASQYAIQRSVQCHIDHIAHNGDPFERGNGRPLDYGHWSAHKIEVLSQYQMRHGEAVAMGIVLDVLYAQELGWLSAEKTQRIIRLIKTLGFNTWHATLELETPVNNEKESLGSASDTSNQPLFMTGLEDFRQHLGGKLSIPVLTDIGVYRNVDTIDHGRMLSAWQAMKKLSSVEPNAPEMSVQRGFA